MLKVVTTLPDSDTGFLHRVFGNIWPSIVTLQDVLLSLTRPCCSCGSYHTRKCVLRHLSLSPYKQLKHMNCHSWITLQSVLIVLQISSLQRDPSPFHIPTEPVEGHPNICFDVGSLGVKWIDMVWNPAQSRDLEPGERETAVENLKPSKHTKIAKLCRHATFCLQMTMMRMTSTQIHMQFRKKDDTGPPWVRERQWPKYGTQKLDFLVGSDSAVERIWRSIVRLSRL